MRHQGGCHCGAIRYVAKGEPYNATACHCLDCRRSSGAPFMAWFSVATQNFAVTQGTMALYASSPGVQRGFCGACGTSLTYFNASLGEVDVSTATLDEPSEPAPRDHIWVQSRIPWVELGTFLPAHARNRDGSG
ncbi:aldehyde-activating protein [Pseudoroseomonas deserti]|uniref:Aldehyde-activating protein n=1 Tax=Teichococcus deserti TaxID=1817963 RepID=A0A1V2H5R3_9PROT|nr:GFA family protein [Pseudoroseomonas deserti]ONG56472.1 aldehyde-activating protein [Pseudoroseomonas deserti]